MITPTHIAHNPRLVKEADCLTAAGHQVRVVSVQAADWIAANDQTLLQSRAWQHDPIRLTPHSLGAVALERFSYFRMHVYGGSSRLGLGHGIAERAYSRMYSELLECASKEPADLFVAHNLETLPIALGAARRWRAKVGFDSEDYHTGEFEPGDTRSTRFRLVKYIESKHIRRCDYVSCPSGLIADALERRYGIPRPLVIHNVFPWADRELLTEEIGPRKADILSLYWFSQTIGLDRGLEDAILACGLVPFPIRIHLRGSISQQVRAQLTQLAASSGVADRLYIHPPISPSSLLRDSTGHDVGLALERPVVESRRLSITNKLFLYLLAGLAVAATDVPGQRLVMETCAQAGLLYPPGDVWALAHQLQLWCENPDSLAANKRAALEAARTRWNWETESQVFLEEVARVLGFPGRGSPA